MALNPISDRLAPVEYPVSELHKWKAVWLLLPTDDCAGSYPQLSGDFGAREVFG
nr:hypothetical protein [Hyphomonas adhaerens]|tara:strand:+ start:175 stop:336 length:162 start_codon:yes stop_codon:yes gene_type:complete